MINDNFKKEICTCKDAAYSLCNVCPKNKDLTEQLRIKGSDGSMFGYSPLYDKAADRIEELEKELAMEKQYFKEVNDKAWDVHGRVRQLEKQAEHLVYALKTIVRVDNSKEWHGFCEVLIEETLKILEGKND